MIKKIMKWLALLLAALSGLFTLILPLFRIQLNNRLYQPNGLQVVLSSLSYEGQVTDYPFILRAAVILMIAGLAAAVGLFLLKKPRWAAYSSALAGAAALLVRLAGSDLAAVLAAQGYETIRVESLGVLWLYLLLPCSAAILILWRENVEQLARAIFLASAAISVASVGLITLYMVIAGLPAILQIGPVNFFLGTVWKPTDSVHPQYGIFNMILATLATTGGSILLGVPIALMTAIFLAKIAPRWITGLVRPAVELLAGIPSVIYGFFGLQLLVPLVQRIFNIPTGATLLSAILILAIMILPTIISTAETGLRAVPEAYMEASLAIGATRIETIFKVLVPAARSSILSGVILGIGRAIGETMAVIMVAGNVANLPGLFNAVKPLTVGIAQEMNYSSGLHRQALFGIGLVLYLFIMLVNLSFNWISRKGVQMDDGNE
ncbi:MAG: phosphate ABC transporter permease subunit PstC [Clostridiaceae bacterium]|nr:phosphate ABC transporter permease subunit PstC [Clostridiaceae bacterium]